MKKLNILLITSLLVFNISCSNDDNDVDEKRKESVFKITLELSGEYDKYFLNYIMTNGPVFENDKPRRAIITNKTTGEEVDPTVPYKLNEPFSIFEAVDKTSYIICTLGGGYIENEPAENAVITYKLYADNKLIQTEDVIIFPKVVNKVTVLEYNINDGFKITVK